MINENEIARSDAFAELYLRLVCVLEVKDMKFRDLESGYLSWPHIQKMKMKFNYGYENIRHGPAQARVHPSIFVFAAASSRLRRLAALREFRDLKN